MVRFLGLRQKNSAIAVMPCPSRKQLEHCLTGDLSESEADYVFLHAESCDACRLAIDKLENEVDDPIENAVRIAIQPQRLPPECEQMIRDSSSLIWSSARSSSRGMKKDTFVADETVRLIELVPGVDTIRDYQVQSRLGQGGMGTVYRATHRHLKRDVAIKVLRPRNHQRDQAASRFRKEMEAVGCLDHKNIIRAMDAGEADGTLYLVMEFIDGVDVSHLANGKALAIGCACEIVRQAAQGLAYAHRKNMVHRDVKPSNLMVTSDGVVKILDFGIATFESMAIRVGDTANDSGETLAGSLAYMAPEQCDNSGDVTPSADIFSLGCTLYELLTGRTLFRLSGDVNAQIDQRRRQDPPPATGEEIPSPLFSLLKRMLSKTADERPTADEVAHSLASHSDSDALLQVLFDVAGMLPESNDGSSTAGSLGKPNTSQRRSTFAKVLFTVCSLFIVAMSGLVVYSLRPHKDAAPPISDSIQAQFLSEISNVSLTTAAIRLETELHQISVRHGIEVEVKSHDGSLAAKHWNSLALRLENEDAYDLYAANEGFLRELNNHDVEVFPHQPDFPATKILVEARDDASGWIRYDCWTPTDSVRIWIGSAKLAVAYVSRSDGSMANSSVQPVERLRQSTEFGRLVGDILGDLDSE